MIRTIPLSKLGVSPGNVRRSGDPQADLGLKADIEACDPLRTRRRAIVPASSAPPARTSWTRASSSSSRKSETDVPLAAPRGGSCGRARTAFPRHRPGTANRN
jgi:hypothetical protein